MLRIRIHPSTTLIHLRGRSRHGYRRRAHRRIRGHTCMSTTTHSHTPHSHTLVHVHPTTRTASAIHPHRITDWHPGGCPTAHSSRLLLLHQVQLALLLYRMGARRGLHSCGAASAGTWWAHGVWLRRTRLETTPSSLPATTLHLHLSLAWHLPTSTTALHLYLHILPLLHFLLLPHLILLKRPKHTSLLFRLHIPEIGNLGM